MILNLTQHNATTDQLNVGVVDLPDSLRKEVVGLITFSDIPTQTEMYQRAERLAEICLEQGTTAVMIGGAPYFMPVLQNELKSTGIQVLYAFTKREVIEEKLPDGSVKKTAVFKHAGFVEA